MEKNTWLDSMYQIYLNNRKENETEDEYYKRAIEQHKKNIQTLDNQIHESKRRMYGSNFKSNI